MPMNLRVDSFLPVSIVLACILGPPMLFLSVRSRTDSTANLWRPFSRLLGIVHPPHSSTVQQLYWLHRAWSYGFPLPNDITGWHPSDDMSANDIVLTGYERMPAWEFLSPFFASRGYTLYIRRKPGSEELIPPADAVGDSEYPYARRLYRKASRGQFVFSRWTVWPARDQAGRDVIIKLVSGKETTVELKILQMFNSPSLRSHPHNHTIHAVEFLVFGQFTFVVMPRWGSTSLHKYDKVADAVHLTTTFLEVLDFMHENLVVHCDLWAFNTGMNLLADQRFSPRLPNVRDPSVTRYTVFDFGNALLFPPGTEKEQTLDDRQQAFTDANEPRNPFEFEVACMGQMLETLVRHIENIIPAFGAFFDKMTSPDMRTHFTAREASEAFTQLRATLTAEQLDHSVSTQRWRRGVST